MLKEKLENKLIFYNEQMNNLLNDEAMRKLCFVSGGCINKAAYKKLNNYRNKIGNYGTKINITEVALKIVNKKTFTYYDIEEIYTCFLQTRNPELYYKIYNENFITSNTIKEIISLAINLFLPTYKKKVLDVGLLYDNGHGDILNVSLSI